MHLYCVFGIVKQSVTVSCLFTVKELEAKLQTALHDGQRKEDLMIMKLNAKEQELQYYKVRTTIGALSADVFPCSLLLSACDMLLLMATLGLPLKDVRLLSV